MTDAQALQAITDLTAELGYPPTTRQLAAHLNCAPSTASVRLHRLEAQGLISRSPDVRRVAVLTRLAMRTEAHGERDCPICGDALDGRRAHAVYCSGACRAEASRRRRAA